MTKNDIDVLRRSIEQVVKIDLSRGSGWREGTSYHLGLPEMRPDMTAGESLVRRGILRRDERGNLTLSEAALLRILSVAIDSAVADLLANDPPDGTLPELPEWSEEEDNARLIQLDGEAVVR